MSTEPRIRPARDADSARVLGILGAVFAEYPGCVLVLSEVPELLAPATSFAREGGAFWVAEPEGGEAVGFVALAPSHEREGWVELKKLYLLAEARGRGLGRRLIDTVEREARLRRAPGVHLWSDTRFTRAHAVYERTGYRRLEGSRELYDASDSREFAFEKPLA